MATVYIVYFGMVFKADRYLEAVKIRRAPFQHSLFHVSKTRNRESIHMLGLQPQDPFHSWRGIGRTRPKGVYGFLNLNDAREWQQWRNQKTGDLYDIWIIPAMRIQQACFDPETYEGQEDAMVVVHPVQAILFESHV
jgi:hypothetical protein